MRITARLDDKSEQFLEKIQARKGFKTITEVLKYSLKEAAAHLEQQQKPGSKMKKLLQSDFVGSFDGAQDLSVNYKSEIADYLDKKYQQHAK